MDLYAIIVGIGATAGLAWAARRAPHLQAIAWVIAGVWVLLGALVGARAAFVAANWLYFRSHLLEAPQVWLGGLFWPGALVGALFVLALLRLSRRVPASLSGGGLSASGAAGGYCQLARLLAGRLRLRPGSPGSLVGAPCPG